MYSLMTATHTQTETEPTKQHMINMLDSHLDVSCALTWLLTVIHILPTYVSRLQMFAANNTDLRLPQ